MAHVTCDNVSFVLNCAPKAIEHKITLHFDEAIINELHYAMFGFNSNFQSQSDDSTRSRDSSRLDDRTINDS
jgi:hypothetical protein